MPDQPNCCLCGQPCEPWHGCPPTGYGHNPDPYGEEDDRCCNACNYTKVIPARLAGFANELDRRNN